jgi:hypothetical protein
MKYSVGDMFLDRYDYILVITSVSVPFSSETWAAGEVTTYSVIINGRNSHLRWYNKDFERMKNITCPVLKELHS